jgi:transcriptional regulator with XRE-family HTH domain
VTATFGRLLREHRDGLGLTQRELAELSTLSERAIRDLEQGRARRPRPVTVRLLAGALGLRDGRRGAFEAAARRSGRTEFAPPAPVSGLVGRAAEVRVLAELLAADGDRVITVTGVSGVGKTRLAADVATRAPGTVLWCAPGAPLPGPLGDVLLVLDGVRAAPATVAELLGRHPRLRVLCTSAAPLGLPGERVVPLLPLAVPGPGEHELEAWPAVRLLLRHIRALDPAFRLDRHTADAVVVVCALTDGHPLALERAALSCALRSVHLVCQELAAVPFPGLGESLAALSPGDRCRLDRLAGMPGPWSVDEAETDPATVHTLLRHGLLRRTGVGRFQVLGLVRSARRQPVGA